MSRVWRWRPAARSDAVDLWRWIAADSPRAANRLFERLDEVAALLAENPLLGRSRDDLAAGLRSMPVGPCVIFYRPTDAGVDIVRVLHGRRDITGELF